MTDTLTEIDAGYADTDTAYVVPWSLRAKAVARLEAANRRAERAGIRERFTWTIEQVTRTDGFGNVFDDARIVMNRPAVRHEGWEFIGTLSWDSDAGLITRMVPGRTAPVRPDTSMCDVCRTNRTRKDTYLVQGGDGEVLQVGRECLKRFLGIRPVGLWMLGYSPEFDDLGPTGIRQPDRFDSVSALSVVLAVVADTGRFVTASAANDAHPSTASLAMLAIVENVRMSPADLLWAGRVRTEARDAAVVAQARNLLAWGANHLEGASDYVANLRAVCAAETVSMRNFALLASVVAAHARAQEKAAVQERAADSQWVGEPKQRLRGLEVTITKVAWVAGYMGGDSQLLLFTDADGNVFKWFRSGFDDDLEVGQNMLLTGTVKGHEEYRGVKQTVLSRCVLDQVPVPA